MAQYTIPQKTQREDTIVGPLTAKQLIYGILTIAGSYILFSTINSNPIIEFNLVERLLIVLPFFLLGMAMAFIEVNERPFEVWLASFLEFVKTPKVRIWQKEKVVLLPVSQRDDSKEAQAQVGEEISQVIDKSKIQKLSQILDNPLSAVDEIGSGPSSRTIELLNTVEQKQSQQEEGPSLKIVAKGKRGPVFFLKSVVTSLGKTLFRAKKKEKIPQLVAENTPQVHVHKSPKAEQQREQAEEASPFQQALQNLDASKEDSSKTVSQKTLETQPAPATSTGEQEEREEQKKKLVKEMSDPEDLLKQLLQVKEVPKTSLEETSSGEQAATPSNNQTRQQHELLPSPTASLHPKQPTASSQVVSTPEQPKHSPVEGLHPGIPLHKANKIINT